jgi:transposase
MAAVVVGIDVSKDYLEVHCRPAGLAFQVARDPAGLDALVAQLAQLQPALVALEASGGFESVVTARLSVASLPVVVVNPVQVRQFARAIGKRAKTDPIDAAVIAHFAEATNPPVRDVPDEATRLLNSLLSRRRQIVEMAVAERQRLNQAPTAALQKSIQRLLKALQRELHELDREIDDTVKRTPAWREKENLLRSVPGIGPVISRTLIAGMPELGRLDRRQVASLAGVAPFTRQSGKWKGKTFIGGGRGDVRQMLYMGALTATRFNPQLSAFYHRLTAAGKAPNQALIAVARKLLVILNAILRDKKPWLPA